MGFSSHLCAKSNLSIPAFPHAELPKEASHIALVLPDNRALKGFYDGYGKIYLFSNFIAYVTTDNRDQYEAQISTSIWEAIKPFMDESKDDWSEYQRLVKIVRMDKYDGDKWEDLQPSKSCPDQGYFYDEDTRTRILSSFPRDLVLGWILSGRID